MQLQTKALDCLYLNWALPQDSAPALPASLRYEAHEYEGRDYVFVSALLFHLAGLRLRSLPFFQLSYPQMNFRVYVLDGDDMPSVLFVRTLVPFWIVPVSRILGRQPASPARFSYPRPSAEPGSDSWAWTVRCHTGLRVAGKLASPGLGPGPVLGPWEKTVEYFRHRRRGYVQQGRRLRPINSSHPSVEVWPLEVEIEDATLLTDGFGAAGDELWRRPHSAWLCPEIPYLFELGELRALSLAGRPVAASESC